MSGLIYLIAVVVVLAGLAYKSVELRRNPSNPALRSICGLLGFLGMSIVVGWHTTVRNHIDATIGVAGVSHDLIARACAMLAAVCVQALVLHLGSQDFRATARRTRARWLVACVLIATMAVGFGTGQIEARDGGDLAGTVSGAISLGAYAAYLTVSLIDILRLAMRYARTAARPLIRLGIRLLSATSIFNFLYVAHTVVLFFSATTRAGKDPPRADTLWNGVFMLGSAVALSVGVVLPSLGPLVIEAVHWPSRWRLYRQLHPLWLAVFRAIPQIALEPPNEPERDRFVGRSIYRALYRRVIEIHDGLLYLGPYASSVGHMAQQEAIGIGADLRAASATADAAVVAIGIRELQGTRQGASSDGLPISRFAEDLDVTDLEVAARRLVAVAEALHESPVVRRMVDRYDRGQLSG